MSDLIRREDAIEALANLTCFGIEEIKAQCYKSVSDGEEGWLGGIRDAVIEIETLPSAEPERKGEWLDRHAYDNADYTIDEWQSAQCSVCGKYHTTPYMYNFTVYKYCPNCGAEMKGGEG